MKISRKDLQDAVEEQIITPEQSERLEEFLKQHAGDGPRFDFTHVLYYLGGLIAIGAMTLFMNLGWESFGGWGILVISLLYAAIGMKLSNSFDSRGHKVPAGICATFVVALSPLAIYGLQQALGLWPDATTYREYHRYIKWHWLYMELATLAVGTIVAWRYKYPFLIMPIAVTLWYLSMDMTAMLSGGDFDWELRKLVSLYSGLLGWPVSATFGQRILEVHIFLHQPLHDLCRGAFGASGVRGLRRSRRLWLSWLPGLTCL
ncbi:MAG: hypothetical protein JXQ81_08400 [Desulfuromonadales bacterium]|nr:hypothetical protein [Desulfuromonadales bacterium]MBN2792510.1 hypothetical protein [Desulfuromonadales bacterium]